MAMSSDFFEILLPKPVPFSEFDIFMGFLVNDSAKYEVFRASNILTTFPFATLPLLTIGDDDCLLVISPEFVFCTCPFTVLAAPGLDLPAERGLSGNVVLRFGGVLCGKSWRIDGLDMRPFEGKDVNRQVLRVGVDGLEF